MPSQRRASHYSTSISLLASLPILSGCATNVPVFDVPYQPTPHGQAPSVASIVSRLQCELAVIADQPGTTQFVNNTEHIIALVELSLTVTDDGALAPTATATNGVFSFMAGFKFEQSRAQNFTENLSFNLSDMKGLSSSEACKQTPDTNLAGNLGLRQMWDMANSSGPFAQWNKTGDTGAFGGSISFTVDKELTATGPTWKLTHFTGPGSFLSAYDKNVDKLTIGFAKGKNAQSAVQDIINKVKQNQQTDALQIIANAQK